MVFSRFFLRRDPRVWSGVCEVGYGSCRCPEQSGKAARGWAVTIDLEAEAGPLAASKSGGGNTVLVRVRPGHQDLLNVGAQKRTNVNKLEGRAYALYVAGLVAFCAAMIIYFGQQGPVEAAFRSARRDSFGTDITEDIAPALPLGRHSDDIVSYVERNGFMCNNSQLSPNAKIWICQRRAWVWRDLGPKQERWVLEFECDPKLAYCTMIKHFGEIRNVY
jgi:hypothetical protein